MKCCRAICKSSVNNVSEVELAESFSLDFEDYFGVISFNEEKAWKEDKLISSV